MYRESEDKKNILLVREKLKLLPAFCGEFIRSLNEITSVKTRLAYTYDLRVFFNYLVEENPKFKNREVTSLTLEDLKEVTARDINDFLDYLSYYIKENEEGEEVEMTNKEKGKSRKLASVRRLFSYFYKCEELESNPASLVETPKIHDKNIIMLEPDEVAKLLDEIESGEKLTPAQKRYHHFTKPRDLALVTLLLGTGMRVSECVGIDISDIDFSVNGIKIVRKGGNEVVIYFGDEVEKALRDYIKVRTSMSPEKESEDALFLSIQNKRINVRSVQNLVKKYSKLVTTMKNISPHKLRSTFGTSLYRETQDIYLVADVLGHSDVNTTKKHYAQMADENRRTGARKIKLREE